MRYRMRMLRCTVTMLRMMLMAMRMGMMAMRSRVNNNGGRGLDGRHTNGYVHMHSGFSFTCSGCYKQHTSYTQQTFYDFLHNIENRLLYKESVTKMGIYLKNCNKFIFFSVGEVGS